LEDVGRRGGMEMAGAGDTIGVEVITGVAVMTVDVRKDRRRFI